MRMRLELADLPSLSSILAQSLDEDQQSGHGSQAIEHCQMALHTHFIFVTDIGIGSRTIGLGACGRAIWRLRIRIFVR